MSVEIADSIIKNLADLIGQALVEGGSKALNQISETLRQNIYLLSRQYSQNYIERHGILKVLGMREPISLESIYVSVQFLEMRTNLSYDTIETLEEAYHHTQQRGFYSKEKRYPGLEVANQKQFLMVLGGPGVGKSTFLRKMGLEALKGKSESGFQHHCIPVFIELKRFRSGNLNFEETIAEIFHIRGFPEPLRFTQKALERGKLLILLDGLDEVPSDLVHEVITGIQNFVDLYDKNRYIASCRLAAYRHNFRRFTDVTIADFSDNQIRNFIVSWFSDQPERGHECWQKLVSHKYAAAKELTHTPLLLTLICLLYQRAGQFPTNRSTLYEKALRVLLEEWAGEKGVPQEAFYRGLDTRRKELMLSEIAFHAFKEDRLFLHKRELAEQIESILKEMLPEESYIDGSLVLKSIEIQHGLLVERAEGIYSFSHVTFQEFLAAQYIVDNHNLTENLVCNYLTHHRWQEVFILLAGLKPADHFLLQMETRTQQYTSSPGLQFLLNWADSVTADSKGESNPVAKRAIAIFLALSFVRTLTMNESFVQTLIIGMNYLWDLTFEIDSSLAMDYLLDIILAQSLSVDNVLEVIVEISKKKIFKEVKFNVLLAKLRALKAKQFQTPVLAEKNKSIASQIGKISLSALGLHQEKMLSFSQVEISRINDYLYATMMIVRCRKSAVRVSQHTWQRIEEMLLRADTCVLSQAEQ
jgi:hypothetical protein